MSRSEVEDICNIILLHMIKEGIPKELMVVTFLSSMVLRSFARVYHEAVGMVEQYAGIIETADRDRKIVEEAKALRSKVDSLEALNREKQQKLNAQQLEIDRLRKALREKDAELAQLQEQGQLLRQYINEESKEAEGGADEPLPIEAALEAKAVVFGGTTAWQSAVKQRAPGYICVDVKDMAFDVKVINNADVIVFKVDYLSHKQFYRAID